MRVETWGSIRTHFFGNKTASVTPTPKLGIGLTKLGLS